MTNYGTKIAELRAANKMTQAELGAMLNVTSQAVSKWENGLSEPDIESIRKICQIFNITFDEFFGAEPKQENAELSPQTPENANGVILAYCDMCDKPLYNPKEYQVSIINGVQHTTCLDCVAQKLEMQAKADEERLAQEKLQEKQEQVSSFKKGLLWGILGAVGLAGIAAITTIMTNEEAWKIALFIILGTYGGYAIVSQCVWGSSVFSVLTFFMRSFRMPGVIFTLSLNGILFLIFVKVFGAILSALLSVLLFIVGFIITWLYAMVIFPFALGRQIIEIKRLS